MKIHITSATQLELTDPLREYIRKRIGSVARFVKRFEKEGEVQVNFEVARTTHHHKSGEVYYAEATVDLAGERIRVEHTDEDVRAAIDKVRDMLKREFRKVKEKHTDRPRQVIRFLKRKKDI